MCDRMNILDKFLGALFFPFSRDVYFIYNSANNHSTRKPLSSPKPSARFYPTLLSNDDTKTWRNHSTPIHINICRVWTAGRVPFLSHNAAESGELGVSLLRRPDVKLSAAKLGLRGVAFLLRPRRHYDRLGIELGLLLLGGLA
jgi:hypothetical protein